MIDCAIADCAYLVAISARLGCSAYLSHASQYPLVAIGLNDSLVADDQGGMTMELIVLVMAEWSSVDSDMCFGVVGGW